MDRLEEGYVVRAYRQGDEEGIVELLELAFDGWPKFDLLCGPLEHWRWKYQDNPLRMNQIVVGVSNNRIVGCLHYPSLRIKIGNRVCLSTQGTDLAVHSDFRRKAIFNKMMDLGLKMRKESGIQLHYSLSWNPILSKTSSTFYHRFPHRVMRFFKIYDVSLQLKKQPIKYGFIYKYGFHLAKLSNKWKNTFRPSHPSSYDFHIGKMTHFDERIEEFWGEISNYYHFVIERSRDYLNWRYCDPRGGDYLVKIAQTGAKILGYMVLRINRHQRDYPIGYIADLLTLPERPDVATALVEDAVNYFDGHSINMTLCMVIKNHPYEAILRRNGFITKGEKPPLFYREYVEVDELGRLEADSRSHIHFGYGDLDVI